MLLFTVFAAIVFTLCLAQTLSGRLSRTNGLGLRFLAFCYSFAYIYAYALVVDSSASSLRLLLPMVMVVVGLLTVNVMAKTIAFKRPITAMIGIAALMWSVGQMAVYTSAFSLLPGPLQTLEEGRYLWIENLEWDEKLFATENLGIYSDNGDTNSVNDPISVTYITLFSIIAPSLTSISAIISIVWSIGLCLVIAFHRRKWRQKNV